MPPHLHPYRRVTLIYSLHHSKEKEEGVVVH